MNTYLGVHTPSEIRIERDKKSGQRRGRVVRTLVVLSNYVN